VNPARLEQRIGRIDRIGQQRAVHAITLVARDTAEDLVIANLVKRLARVVVSLGEKDRLGAFLTDARTARLVIGGAPLEETEPAAAAPQVNVERAPATSDIAGTAADQLRLARLVNRGRVTTASSGVMVSSLRASRAVPAGFVVAFRCEAKTEDGDVVAGRIVLLHMASNLARPSSPAAARSMAAGALATAPGVERLVPGLAAWFADVRQIHETTVDRRLARETALRDRPVAPVSVQPGLFDRRALRAAEDLSDAGRLVRSEHSWQLAALARARSLTLACTPAAVLVVWR
jgi:hypothetical protein